MNLKNTADRWGAVSQSLHWLVVLLITAIAGPIWLQQRQERRMSVKNALYATLPSLLAIEGWPDERALAAFPTVRDFAAINQAEAIRQ